MFSAILLLFFAPSAQAQSGADVLFQSVKGNGSKEIRSESLRADTEFKTTDPFLLSFLSEWRGGPRLPFHINQWAQKILTHDFHGASHLWTQVRKSVPESWADQAGITYAYLLWRQGLDRTFWKQWMALLANPQAAQSSLMTALHQTIQSDLPRWLLERGPQVDAVQRQTISGLKDQSTPVVRTLAAWSLLRAGRSDLGRSIQVLEALPVENPLKIPLAKTVVLQFARKGELAKAAQYLKEELEPAITASGLASETASYMLQLARLLYQAGNLDAAEQYYLKIPKGAAEYLVAHEELAWVLLRKGDLSRLRGEVASFETGLMDEKFLPEIHMVAAVSNLKLCFYPQVEKNFKEFQRVNGKWAERIQGALKAPEPPRPPEADAFTLLAERALESRRAELKKLQTLAQESINAALPAVGVQAHWTEAVSDLQGHIEDASKLRAHEFRRQWKNMEFALREAITKMKFVKVELVTQLTELAQRSTAQDGLSDQVRMEQSAEVRAKSGEQVFPFDGVLWPDELFRLKSATRGKCLMESSEGQGGA
jgi:hypothetical protein